MISNYGSECDPGGHRGLQSRSSGEKLEGGFDSHTFPLNFMSYSKYISYFIKMIWFIVFLLIIFIDRDNSFQKYITIIFLLIISAITVIRALNSRNEWREIIEDGDVEIKEKISFDD